jgi:hypothetical protein
LAKPNFFLIAGGVISGLISLLHVILALNPALYLYFGPDQASALSQLAVQGSSLTTIVTFALALIFAIWAIYAFSGAGMIRRLPLLRMALIAIGVIYILRSLFLPTEIRMVLNEGYAFRFVVFSAISLIAGLLYLSGVLMLRATSKSSQQTR